MAAPSTDGAKARGFTSAAVFVDNVQWGGTRGGIKIQIKDEHGELLFDQNGVTPVDIVRKGRKVTAQIPLAEQDYARYLIAMPGCVAETSGADTVGLKIGSGLGGQPVRDSDTHEVIFKRVIDNEVSTDEEEWFTIPVGAFTVDMNVDFDPDSQNVAVVNVFAFPDGDGYLAYLGNVNVGGS